MPVGAGWIKAFFDQGKFHSPAVIVEIAQRRNRSIVAEGKAQVIQYEARHGNHRVAVPVVHAADQLHFAGFRKIIVGQHASLQFCCLVLDREIRIRGNDQVFMHFEDGIYKRDLTNGYDTGI